VVLCGKLTAIEYIDVAEHSLYALEKLSYRHRYSCCFLAMMVGMTQVKPRLTPPPSFLSSDAILRAGGASASLVFVDFFPVASQRVAVTIVANVCHNIPSDAFAMVQDLLPVLTNLLHHSGMRLLF
jgi:E3 ubiquitin-protein ligase TRIP12